MNEHYEKRYAKRSLGQNFLVDEYAIRQIVYALGDIEDRTVVEIGPGRGALTEHLINAGAHVIAIEKDDALAAELRHRYAHNPSFNCINADILTADLRQLLSDARQSIRLVGNLPYNISTAILTRIAEQRDLFELAVFMFQREVGDRITAQPGSSTRGFLTVMTEAAFDVERLFDIPPEAFNPRPKIWSSVVSLVPKPPTSADEPAFAKLVAAAFGQKRKTLLNNLKNVLRNPKDVLTASNIDPTRRAETLTLAEWLELSQSRKAEA